MRVTLAQLEAFYWTAQLGSAFRAAQHLHLSQPTISLRLKDLATATGADLLERTAQGLRVTPDGRAMLPRVAAILGEVHGILGLSPAQEITGAIRVGLADGFAVTCLPSLLAALLEDYPALQPEWVVATAVTLEAELLKHTLDLAVLLNPIGDEQLELVPLGAQPTTWAAPAAWGMARPVTPDDLQTKPIITNPPPSAMHRQITGWFATSGIAPERLSTCTSLPVIAELVASGIGASLLPVPVVERYVTAGTMHLLASVPRPENGRLFIARHAGVTDAKLAAVTRTITRVVRTIGYLG